MGFHPVRLLAKHLNADVFGLPNLESTKHRFLSAAHVHLRNDVPENMRYCDV